MDALVRLTDAINNNSDINLVVREIIEECAHLCETDMATAYLYTDEGELESTIHFGLPKHFAHEVERLGRARWAVSDLIQQGRPMIARMVVGGPYPSPLHKLATSEGVVALVSMPMCHKDKVLGLILLYQRGAGGVDLNRRNELQALANLGALAVAHARLVETRKWERNAQDQFLDILGHELRTPLTSIMGFAQIVRKRLASIRDTDPRVLEQLDLLWAQSLRLRRLLDAFADVTNIERGEFVIERERVDVVAALREGIAQSRAQAHTRHRIDVEAPDYPIWLSGDNRRLEFVFIQLVSNAIRYSPVDKPIVIECKERETGEVIITMIDQGPGIPSDLQREIFKRFFPSDTRKAGGMGMGLYLSRAIIEAHGGNLSIDSMPGTGTVVGIALPTE